LKKIKGCSFDWYKLSKKKKTKVCNTNGETLLSLKNYNLGNEIVLSQSIEGVFFVTIKNNTNIETQRFVIFE